MIYLITIFSLLFFLLAWRRLDWAVAFLIAAMPAYLIRFNIFGLPSTILEIMIWIVFLVWLIKNLRALKNNFLSNFKNKKISNRYPFDWEMILMVIVALVAAGVAGFSASSLGIWKAYFFEPILFFIVVFNVMNGEKGREKILWALAISALAISALAIYQKITGQLIDNPTWAAAETRRVVSFFGYPNAVGLYLGPIVLIMTGWLWNEMEKIKKIINWKNAFIFLVIVFSLLSIYFAKSKGAALGVAAGLIIFGFLAGKKIKWITIIGVLIMTLGLSIYQPARQKALDTMQFKTLSGQIRKVGWEETKEMLKDKRIISGAGLANFQNAIAPYHAEGFFIKNDDPDWLKKIRASAEYRKKMWQPLEIYLYPHNIILNFWSELGLAGLILFIWVIGKYFYLGFSNLKFPAERFFNIGLICAMVAIVVHGIVDVPYFKNDLSIMFWLFIAMMSLINLENKKYGKNS